MRHLLEVLSVSFEFKEECDWTKHDDALIPALADKVKQEIERSLENLQFNLVIAFHAARRL